jgi:hypothetical protein
MSNSRALVSLEHCWTLSISCGAFVTLGGLPPRRLGVAHKLPRCGELWTVCEGRASPPKGKKLSRARGGGCRLGVLVDYNVVQL